MKMREARSKATSPHLLMTSDPEVIRSNWPGRKFHDAGTIDLFLSVSLATVAALSANHGHRQ
jgi:hypothetical protein